MENVKIGDAVLLNFPGSTADGHEVRVIDVIRGFGNKTPIACEVQYPKGATQTLPVDRLRQKPHFTKCAIDTVWYGDTMYRDYQIQLIRGQYRIYIRGAYADYAATLKDAIDYCVYCHNMR